MPAEDPFAGLSAVLAAAPINVDPHRQRRKGVPEVVYAAGKTVVALDITNGRRWFVLHCGASAPSRRYPPEQFAQAARSLAREAGCAVVFTGSLTAEQRNLNQTERIDVRIAQTD